MAAGYHDFTAGETLTAANLEDYCELQGIMRFASAAARDTALASVLTEGLFAYLIDVNCITVYSGSAWSTVGPVHGVWTSYTPTWAAAAGSAPAIGNGTLDGAYIRTGRLVTFRARMLAGSTTTFGSAGGSNYWRFGVPFASGAAIFDQPIATVCGSITIPNTTTTGVIRTNTSYVEQFGLRQDSRSWIAGDVVLMGGTYEVGADA